MPIAHCVHPEGCTSERAQRPAGHLRRRGGRGRAHRRGGGAHAQHPQPDAVAGARVHGGGEVREPAVRGGLQGAGRAQPAAADDRRRAGAGRGGDVGRQPRPGGRLPRHPAGHLGHHRHAPVHAVREGAAHPGAGGDGGAGGRRPPRGRGRGGPAGRGGGAHVRPPLRRPGGHRRAGHVRTGDAGRRPRPRRAGRPGRRGRPAGGDGGRGPAPGARHRAGGGGDRALRVDGRPPGRDRARHRRPHHRRGHRGGPGGPRHRRDRGGPGRRRGDGVRGGRRGGDEPPAGDREGGDGGRRARRASRRWWPTPAGSPAAGWGWS